MIDELKIKERKVKLENKMNQLKSRPLIKVNKKDVEKRKANLNQVNLRCFDLETHMAQQSKSARCRSKICRLEGCKSKRGKPEGCILGWCKLGMGRFRGG